MVKIYVSSVVDAPAERVWDRVRDFNGLPKWHPIIADSRIEGNQPADKVGCIRSFHTRDGGHIRERLLALSDYELSCTYAILESPMPVENYIASLALTPITDGNRTFAEWQADFDCAPERETMLSQQIGNGVFQTGLNALKQRFRR
jgi:uncharacterized protein YndB with AHSA1/START domain